MLLVADEVVTGFGRTGRWFACDHWHVTPDIMILGKGMTGGYYALAALALRRHVAERLARRLVPHGFTYSGHPTSCAVALRNLQVTEEEGLVEQVAEKGAHLQKKLAEPAYAIALVGTGVQTCARPI